MLKDLWSILLSNMSNCSAFGCTICSEKKKISFYQIPGEKWDKILRKTWLYNIKIDGPLSADQSFYICAKHFEESCFERDLKVGEKQSLKCVP